MADAPDNVSLRPVWWTAPPDPAGMTALAEMLGRGGVVVLPTDTIYGLHAVATDASAVARIAGIKGREAEKPMVVLIASWEQLALLGATVGGEVTTALRDSWPAPLTAIVPLDRPLPASGGRFTLAIRMPDVAWLRTLIEETGPLASTSLNRSGEPPVCTAGNLDPELLSAVDGVVDGGTLEGLASTIVDFTVEPPRTVREGRFDFRQIMRKRLWKNL